MKKEIELGVTARDIVTGYTGVVVARHKFLTGCDRVTLQGKVKKDGSCVEDETFDVNALEVLKNRKRIQITADDDDEEDKGGFDGDFTKGMR